MDKDTLLLNLNEKWKCDLQFGWIPIKGDESIPNVEIYESNYFEYYIEEVKRIIKNKLRVTHLFEMREDGQFKELSVDDCDFSYDGLEYMYTNEGLDFVLYFSHEVSSTIGGEALLQEIHSIWPEYRNHLWKPFSFK